MARFAQIQDGRVRWVFEADAIFPHAPYVEIVDVTGVVPLIVEGARRNPDGTFTNPPPPGPVPPSALKTALEALIADPAFAALAARLRDVMTEWNRVVR